MKGHWCVDILDRVLTSEEVERRKQLLMKWFKDALPADGHFTLKWLGEMMQKIDELWYDSKLLPALTKSYGGLIVRADVDSPSIAGYVVEAENRSKIYLHMNRSLFQELFHLKESASYHAGGLVCKDRFTCFMDVLLHETVHLLLTFCDKVGARKEVNHHGKDFKKVIRSWFGHQEQQHGLIQGFQQTHDMDSIRAHVKPGALVQIFDRVIWVPAKVLKRGSKFVWAQELCKSRGARKFKVHIGLVRPHHESQLTCSA